MKKVTLLVNPFTLGFLLCLSTPLLYGGVSIYLYALALIFFVFSVFHITFYHNILNRLSVNLKNHRTPLNNDFWRAIGFFVIIVSVIEYYYFGVPIFDDILYTKFGYPLLHHFAVLSWILCFINFKLKSIRRVFIVFSIINPFLMLNRDLLLITALSLFLAMLPGLKASTRAMALLFIPVLALAIFVLLGIKRSAYAIDVVNLPIAFDINNNAFVFWVVTYFTSSTFNLGYNLDYITDNLYSGYINAFPEYYNFIVIFGYGGIFIYCFLVLGIFISFLGIRRKEYSILLLFFIYQFYMSVIFSTKIFVTHTLFVIIIFMISAIYDKLKYLHKN